MRIENIVGVFLEDALQSGAEAAIDRLRRKVPFCADLPLLAEQLQSRGEQVLRLRRGCLTIAAIAAAGLLAAIISIVAASLPSTLRIFSCFVASTSAVTAVHFIRVAVILTPQPFLEAASFVRGWSATDTSENCKLVLQPSGQS